ncbi:carboxynorspermidine decarboxylase [Helicobacter pylori]|uniref:carboxynorspermidine decarboxylase n=1 Tax=Helicobacter pylori TaxID=210 RepID=UPI00112CCE74|nr:carboxynorspermidine decarboxylase [Helicobacter pylori]TPH53131.1 carboxynorspermidine decarboxylase [Helicobacter pylori]GHP66542.1 carboxynorspermidine/carboxyspermidine decarboxylase [Helicobacter pylori]GHP66976.1 carboxynorspermidine/carboxyspermidine decarboxylase [Helicobacter pylori]GHQ01884.1 carboxynorspermidine/carboxyspermidine decarboxylase [Helicobacter pylori]GHR27603.1 carboxynorspermidine/carboxyspermidine decarboxylase [Helicobacter pylori]
MKKYSAIPTPCYVLESERLEKNAKILEIVRQQSGAKVLLALKGYAFWREFGILRQKLNGCCASGLYEAKLAFEEFGGRESQKEICVYSPAFKEAEMSAILPLATSIIFNSFYQYATYKDRILDKNKQLENLGLSPIKMGLRINPLYSEVTLAIYNPCSKVSRLGVTPSEFEKGVKEHGLEGVSGLHFHTHCEQNADALCRTLEHVEKHFKPYLENMEWVNFGGGHHITRSDYDVNLLIQTIKDFKERYHNIEVVLEPGEAIGWQCGFLIASVIDIVKNDQKIALLDASFSAHMPDCLEMPYRPSILKISVENDEELVEVEKGENQGAFSYFLGGPTCLAGDFMGSFSFDTPLKRGDKIVFQDMLHYTIVKNNSFNGVPLPSLAKLDQQGFKILKNFSYEDYKNRN